MVDRCCRHLFAALGSACSILWRLVLHCGDQRCEPSDRAVPGIAARPPKSQQLRARHLQPMTLRSTRPSFAARVAQWSLCKRGQMASTSSSKEHLGGGNLPSLRKDKRDAPDDGTSRSRLTLRRSGEHSFGNLSMQGGGMAWRSWNQETARQLPF